MRWDASLTVQEDLHAALLAEGLEGVEIPIPVWVRIVCRARKSGYVKIASEYAEGMSMMGFIDWKKREYVRPLPPRELSV